jgi:uncharacterized protein GlcG (DUF336 family)
MNRSVIVSIMVVVFFIFISGIAMAQGVRTERSITLALANEAATAAVEACLAKGWFVSAAVVDRAGALKALQRADGAGFHTVDAAKRKAYTSASMRNNTSAILENIKNNPSSTNLSQIDNFLILGGGMPIRAGDEVVGAIGVGGAPGGHLDDQCAEAALAKIKERLK